ncbi:MAG: glycosyltransferase [Planctomycetota bacterium]
MSAPVPILYAIPRSELGGAQRSLLLLLRALDRAAFPPRVFLGEEGPLRAALERLQVPFELARAGFKSPRVIPQFLRYAKGARILHLFGARTLAVAARGVGMKVVERVNLLRSPEAGGLVKNATLDRLLLKLADLVIVPAHAMEEQLLERGVADARIRLIPNGVHLDAPGKPRVEVRRALGVAPDALLVLGVGRLQPVKGFDVLVAAFADVKRELAAAELRIAGAGAEPIHSTFQLGDREDVSDLLEAADIFVQPSRSEVLSNALLEAMLAGRACVATDVGGTAEVVKDGETGLLVPAEDPAALAAAIVRLGRDAALRERLGAAARALVLRERSLEAMARAHEAVYRELVA